MNHSMANHASSATIPDIQTNAFDLSRGPGSSLIAASVAKLAVGRQRDPDHLSNNMLGPAPVDELQAQALAGFPCPEARLLPERRRSGASWSQKAIVLNILAAEPF
jgi:hypothetical protein